jgi:hypothetical protein
MREHDTPTPPPSQLSEAARRLWFHRHRLAAAAALAFAAAVLLFVTPWLLAVALLEHHRSGRRKRLFGLILLTALAAAIAWLWRELRRHPLEPRGPWHPCRLCGFPIADRSRARYCSGRCRSRARLLQRAEFDHRAAARLARLEQPASSYDPATTDIPF